MKYMTAKRKQLERAYLKIRNELLEENHFKNDARCWGCSQVKELTGSHRVPKSKQQSMIAEKKNIDLYCFECHMNYERGAIHKLDNAFEMLCELRDLYFEHFMVKLFQLCDHLRTESASDKRLYNLINTYANDGTDKKFKI